MNQSANSEDRPLHGLHHRVIQRVVTEQRPDGTTAERVARYTELATGLHYQNERGEWLESKEEIEIFQGSAVARQGQHSMIFAAQLNSPGAIDLLSPDGSLRLVLQEPAGNTGREGVVKGS